ncbi:Ste5 [Kluyveromyces lactis]|nr:Ste5 [Kluyveromyces lactis]
MSRGNTASMNSQDILFQLTNVGSSPVPKLDTGSTSGSNTSSPRRWTELFSKKRVKTPSVGTPSTASSTISSFYDSSPIRPVSKQHSKHLLVDPTVPPPPIMLSPIGHGTLGKKPIRKNGNKSWKNERCCICGDLCSFKGSNEKVIPLECNHMCHEDCLMVSLRPLPHKSNLYDVLPKCDICSMSCIPGQEDMRQKVRSHLLTLPDDGESVGLGPYKPQENYERIKLCDADLLPKHSGNDETFPYLQTTKTTARNNDIRLSFAFSLKPGKTVTPSLRDSIRLHRSRSIKRRSNFRGSTVSGLSSIVSSSSKDDCQLPSLHVQRQYFIQAFLNSFNEVKPWEIDSKYGLLRLIDNFLISLDGITFQHHVCYLFSEYLLVCRPSPTTSANVLQFSSYRCFQLNNPPELDLLDATTLESKSSSGERILIKPYGLDTKALEKWITALFDLTLPFGNYDFTSIKVPEFVACIPSANDTGTIIVRRQSTLNETLIPKKIRDSSVLTSISSILSIKRATPNELNLVLQLDGRKTNEDNIISIKNVILALTWKFSTFNCCLVDVDGMVINCGTANDVLNSLSGPIKSNSNQPFSPDLLHELWYRQKQKICKNVGVVVLSNSTMENGKSCLFSDYRIFADAGKRHPNELKIKVGFLNVDYSDNIKELVEIQDWNELLEAVAYSFNLSFDDDLDSSDCVSTSSSDFEVDSIPDKNRTFRLSSPITWENHVQADLPESMNDISESIEDQQSNHMYHYL